MTWSSSSPSIATISNLGVVTAAGTGTVSIREQWMARVERDARRDISHRGFGVGDRREPSLRLGQSTQATAVVKDASGNTVTAPVTWSSSAPAVATVSSTGLVAAVSAGSATITATNGTASGRCRSGRVSRRQLVRVRPDSRAGIAAQFVDSKFVAPTGSTINVPPGGDIQAAINSAKPGDEIVLQAGATYNGNYS